jgi:hypothetical protein
VVSAKTLEIREVSTVTCSAWRRTTGLVKMLDQLRAARRCAISKWITSGARRRCSSFNFHWGEGGGDAN